MRDGLYWKRFSRSMNKKINEIFEVLDPEELETMILSLKKIGFNAINK